MAADRDRAQRVRRDVMRLHGDAVREAPAELAEVDLQRGAPVELEHVPAVDLRDDVRAADGAEAVAGGDADRQVGVDPDRCDPVGARDAVGERPCLATLHVVGGGAADDGHERARHVVDAAGELPPMGPQAVGEEQQRGVLAALARPGAGDVRSRPRGSGRVGGIPFDVGDAEGQALSGQQRGDAATLDARGAGERAGGRGADHAGRCGVLDGGSVEGVQVVADRREEQDEVAVTRGDAAERGIDGLATRGPRVVRRAAAHAAHARALCDADVDQAWFPTACRRRHGCAT